MTYNVFGGTLNLAQFTIQFKAMHTDVAVNACSRPVSSAVIVQPMMMVDC